MEMSDPVTTNLRFPRAEYEELLLRARRRGVSMATLVREAVAQYLGRESVSSQAPLEDPVDALVGAFTGGSRDESINDGQSPVGLSSLPMTRDTQ